MHQTSRKLSIKLPPNGKFVKLKVQVLLVQYQSLFNLTRYWIIDQRTLTTRGRNTPWPTFCFISLDFTNQVKLLFQRTLTYFVRGSITVWRVTSCLIGLDSTNHVNLYLIQHKQSSWILTSQTGGQPPYSDTSPHKVSECSLVLSFNLSKAAES